MSINKSKGKRKKRTWYATDEEYRMIASYAASKGRDISNFLRFCAKGEMNKHVKSKDLWDMVKEILSELLKNGFSTPGNTNNEEISGGLG